MSTFSFETGIIKTYNEFAYQFYCTADQSIAIKDEYWQRAILLLAHRSRSRWHIDVLTPKIKILVLTASGLTISIGYVFCRFMLFCNKTKIRVYFIFVWRGGQLINLKRKVIIIRWINIFDGIYVAGCGIRAFINNTLCLIVIHW